MWYKDKFRCVKQVLGNMSIGVIGEYLSTVNDNPIQVAIFNVLSSCELNEKLSMWEELVKVKLGEEVRNGVY